MLPQQVDKCEGTILLSIFFFVQDSIAQKREAQKKYRTSLSG